MRWILRGMAAVLVLAGLALGMVWLLPAEVVVRTAAAEFQRLTGRALTIEGAARPTLWPVIGVRAGPVTLANAGWSEAGPMLTAGTLSVALDSRALLSGQVRLRAVEVQDARLVLERAADGRVNWAAEGTAPPHPVAAPGSRPAPPVALERLALRAAEVVWIDHAAGRRLAIGGLDAALDWPDPEGRLVLEGAGQLADTPLRLRLEAPRGADLLAGRVTQIALEAAAGGSRLRFDGQAGHAPPAAAGRLQLDLADMRAVAALTGTAVPDLPEGLGRRVREVSGDLTLASAGSLHLRGGEAVLDANRLAVEADVTFDGPRPKLAARVTAGTLTLPGLAAPAASPGAAGAADAGWSRARLDASALALMDAEVALAAEAIDFGPARIGPARLHLTLDRARLVTEARELRAFGGQIAGQFVVNARGGLSVGGDLVFAGLQMQALGAALAGWDRLSGPGDLRVKFLGVGDSLAAIMGSLSGEGRLVLGRGELRGLDLLGMLRTLDTGHVGEGQTTIFDAVSASFTIAGGVLSNGDLRLSAPLLEVSGAGTLGLGAQVIDYRLVPTALAGEDGSGGVRVPLVVSGPWSAPLLRLDLRALAEQQLAEERARLEERAREAEARARAELQRRAAEDLGVVPQEGETLEDAARRRAEEALREGAGRALDRLLGGGTGN